ncbi:hypothetical protein [Aporhodopirellula aestuarii]|uniref:ABC transporter permease n=1 Tax=Aporhodopirellula aestuarii TaxID=2950107 RepID=A0ABT0U0Y9_9BACT|nr:hypothetical protein [Aporhodopirellula aestuarii]MCM2370502.1 hypothetical protein [Aporhodopirellula aestuarii]
MIASPSFPIAAVRPLWHLLWKDLRLLRSLMLAALIGPLVLAVLLSVNHSMWGVDMRGKEGAFGALWFLPGLVTLGAAPMLVGTENEERTFDWIRRLPTPWWLIVISKMIAGLLLILTSIIWVGAIYCFCYVFLDLKLELRLNQTSVVWVGFVGFCLLTYSNVVVLTCGFLTAFSIRNSLASAIAILPIAIVWLIAVSLYADRFIPTASRGGSLGDLGVFWQQAVVYAVPLLFHVLMIGVVFGLAKRRLVAPSDESWRLLSLAPDARPVALKMCGAERPSIFRAMVWQHAAQNRWLLHAVVLVAIGSMVMLAMTNGLGDVHGFLTFAVFMLLQMTLGVSVFHGDNRMPRRYFFADRGVSPAMVWWTRMLVPASLAFAISIAWILISLLWRFEASYLDYKGMILLGLYTLCFLIGASTGQWVRRGVMAYFAAPGVAYFGVILAALAASPLPEVFETFAVVSIMGAIALLALLGSTWHLSLLTLRGKERWELWLPAWGWISLPILVIAIASVSARLLEFTALLGDTGS